MTRTAPTKSIMTITPAAAEQIKVLLAKREKASKGVRIGVRARGCSGMSYTLEYVDELVAGDEVIEDHGVTVYVDPKATLYIIGMEMDFVSDKIQSGFTFSNPNEKGRCGCGESFHV